MSSKQYEILALTLRYWFLLLIVLIFAQSAGKTIRSILSGKKYKRTTGNIPFLLVMFCFTAFGLLAFRNPNSFDMETALLGLLISAIILFQFYFLYYAFRGLDEVLLLIVDTLAVIGFVILRRLTPELALRQVKWFAAGNVFMILVILIVPRINRLRKLLYPLMVLGPAILFMVAFFGEESGGATSRLPIFGDFSIQPSEIVKLLFVIVLAYSLDREKTFRQKLPLFLFAGSSILAVVLQKDLGGALHYILVFLFVYYIATNDWLLTAFGTVAGAVASLISYRIFPHVKVRVEAWKNPWADIGGRGYQVAQSLIAMSSGSWIGIGLGLGIPYIIPASRTDFIFAAICEEFGILVGGLVIGFYVLLLIRSMQIALRAYEVSDMLLVCASSISLLIQAFIIIGGVIKMIPLTGITLPFVSYGGSSMVVSLCIFGIMEGVCVKIHSTEADNDRDEDMDDEISDEDD